MPVNSLLLQDKPSCFQPGRRSRKQSHTRHESSLFGRGERQVNRAHRFSGYYSISTMWCRLVFFARHSQHIDWSARRLLRFPTTCYSAVVSGVSLGGPRRQQRRTQPRQCSPDCGRGSNAIMAFCSTCWI